MIKILRIRHLDKIKEELIRIYVSAYQGLEEYAYTRRADIKRYIKWLHKVDQDGLLIAKDDKEIIGFIFFCHNWWDRMYGEIGEIHELAVIPGYQGRHIGKSLLQEGINCMKKYHNIFGLWVGERNKKAKEFYKKMGFLCEGRMGKWIRMIKKE